MGMTINFDHMVGNEGCRKKTQVMITFVLLSPCNVNDYNLNVCICWY